MRTVFEQHVRLFFSDSERAHGVKTLILVVIRNYERETAAESHSSDLMVQFNNVSPRPSLTMLTPVLMAAFYAGRYGAR